MNRIHTLCPQLANQIAAGEVIERPASVMKELLENSIDAQATHIQVEIEQGGVSLIRVRDNGVGIIKEDLELALARHATSKIKLFSDFERLNSLGFRGEALASICSISRLILTSCAKDATQAWQVIAEGLTMQAQVQPASHPIGTTVEVQDLFYNTPVRRKFLRSEKTEFMYLEDMLRKLALSQFDIGFALKHNQRAIFNLLPASSERLREARVATLCGKAFLQQSVFVDFHAIGLRLTGWLGLPQAARSQNDLQYFYVNGRPVRDRLLMHAVRQAYDQTLPEGRHPCYVLYLELEPAAVDVNVHPTKYEVRFRESRLIHDFIVRHLMPALMPNRAVPLEPEVTAQAMPARDMKFQAPHIHHVREQMAAYKTLHEWPEQAEILVQSREEPTVKKTPPHAKKILSMAGKKFVIIEDDSGLSILSVAQINIHYTISVLALAQRGIKPQSQPFLIPPSVTVSATQMIVLMKHQDWMSTLGIVYDQLSPSVLLVRELPRVLTHLNLDQGLKQAADYLTHQEAGDTPAELFVLLAHLAAPVSDELPSSLNEWLATMSLADLPGVHLDWHQLAIKCQ